VTGFDVSVQDASGKVVTWNEEAERLVCYSEPKIVGRSGDFIFTRKDRSWGAPERELLNGVRYGPTKTIDGTSERMARLFGDPVSFATFSAPLHQLEASASTQL
jgi:PAS domain-containing protein